MHLRALRYSVGGVKTLPVIREGKISRSGPGRFARSVSGDREQVRATYMGLLEKTRSGTRQQFGFRFVSTTLDAGINVRRRGGLAEESKRRAGFVFEVGVSEILSSRTRDSMRARLTCSGIISKKIQKKLRRLM